jgi:hypothetical protein
VRLVAVEDATGNQDQPTVNLGSATELQCGKDFASSPTFRVWFTRGHLRFDVAPLIGRPAPDRVRLQVYQHRSNAAGCLDVTVHRITSPWNEATLTWQNMPTHDATAVGSACVGSSFDSGWKSVDVTQLGRDWIAGTVPNFGLVIRDPSESPAGAARPLYCHSRESASAGLLPHLEVSYGTLPFGLGCGPNNMVPQLDLLDGEPAIGRSYTLRGAGFTGQSSLLELIGRSNSTWNGIGLPLDLTAIGFPGCSLQVSGQILLTGTADFNGRATLTIPVPADPSLVGARVYTQIAGIDTNLRLALTNGFVALLF